MIDELTPEEREAKRRCLELLRALAKTPVERGSERHDTPDRWPAGVMLDGSPGAPLTIRYARSYADGDPRYPWHGETWAECWRQLCREAVDTVEAMEEAALKCRMAAERVRRAMGER